MSGLGAWSFGWYHRDMEVTEHRVARGIVAFKHELVYGGLATKGFLPDAEVYGKQMEELVVQAQTTFGVAADGVIGPATALHLWRKRCYELETAYEIPGQLLTRLKSLESNNDPVAQGYVDREDEGIVELHMPYWPQFTVEQAWDPAVALPAAARKLFDMKAYCGSWRAAVAGWNVGQEYARQWKVANYPSIGGPIMGTDDHGRPIRAFERASNYYGLVTKAAA